VSPWRLPGAGAGPAGVVAAAETTVMADIGGQPMLRRVLERCAESRTGLGADAFRSGDSGTDADPCLRWAGVEAEGLGDSPLLFSG